MNEALRQAPELTVTEWLNTESPIELSKQRGKVLIIEVFQMLCPGCVSHGLPQAQRILETFNPDDVTVIGLHSVFEHHEAQGTRAALEAFLHEYRIRFPVAIDEHSDQKIPKTMSAYALQGTPSLVLIDRQGRIRQRHFGSMGDLVIGAQIMQLVGESSLDNVARSETNEGCDGDGCSITSQQ